MIITSVVQGQIEYSNQDTVFAGGAASSLTIAGSNVTTPKLFGIEIIETTDNVANTVETLFKVTNTSGSDVVWDTDVAGGQQIDFKNILTLPGLFPGIGFGQGNPFHVGKMTFAAGESLLIRTKENTTSGVKTLELTMLYQINTGAGTTNFFQDVSNGREAQLLSTALGAAPITAELKLLVEENGASVARIAHITNKSGAAVDFAANPVSFLLSATSNAVTEGVTGATFEGQNTVSGLWQVNETITLKTIIE